MLLPPTRTRRPRRWAITFFNGQRYELRAWVVMPNHAHVVVWPMPGYTLSGILHGWKSFTSHQINERLPQTVAPFWQSESYEHLIRDDEDLHRCCHYTLMNPVNAGLCAQPEDWQWSSAYVAQPSPAASSSTVPVRESEITRSNNGWVWRRDAALTRRRGRLRYVNPRHNIPTYPVDFGLRRRTGGDARELVSAHPDGQLCEREPCCRIETVRIKNRATPQLVMPDEFNYGLFPSDN